MKIFLLSLIALLISTQINAMPSCECLEGEWLIPHQNIKEWVRGDQPLCVIIDRVEHIPGTDGIYQVDGYINGHIMVDSKCIEQYGHVETVALISKEFFLRSNAPCPWLFDGIYRSRYVVPCCPTLFGLI